MKAIPLTRFYFALLDDEDYDRIAQYKWFARRTGNTIYAVRSVSNPDGSVYMHREILRAPDGLHVDHLNGNGLDNRRGNIRLCLRYENNISFRKMRDTKAIRYRGVTQKRNRFRARITVRQREISLGCFATAEEAAKAYDAAALKYFGEFACPNFKPPVLPVAPAH